MINQSINLYLPEFRRKKEWLDAPRAFQLFSVFIALLLNLSAFAYWESYRLVEDLATLEKQHAEAIANTQKISNLAGSRTADESLDARNLALESMLESKQVLLDFMRGKSLGNAQGFSAYLGDLSQYHTAGLSLDNIALLKGGSEVVLGGQVLRAKLVPLYLQQLSQGTSFNGKSFQTLEIAEVTTDNLLFPAYGRAGEPEIWRFAVSTGHQE